MEIHLDDWLLIKTSQIEGKFTGFNSEMIFSMADGTHWIQTVYKYVYYYAYRPAARIYQNGIQQILYIEEMNDYAVVKQIPAFTSHIINDFNGWTGDTIFELQNGQIWQQVQYQYKYFYIYRPKVTIANIGGRHIMNVDGNSIPVRRIK